MEEDIFSNEGQLEDGETRSEEGQALDDATYEPRAYVEQSGDYQQAEDIQANLVAVTENAVAAAENEGASPSPISRPEDQEVAGSQPEVRGDLDQASGGGEGVGKEEAADEEISDLPMTVSGPTDEEISGLPVPIPGPADEEISDVPVSIPVPQPLDDLVSNLPIPLPLPEPADDMVSNLPIPLPLPEPADDMAGGLPVPIPGPEDDPAGIDPRPIIHPSGNEVDMPGALPIPNPDEADYYTPDVIGATGTTKKAA